MWEINYGNDGRSRGSCSKLACRRTCKAEFGDEVWRLRSGWHFCAGGRGVGFARGANAHLSRKRRGEDGAPGDEADCVEVMAGWNQGCLQFGNSAMRKAAETRATAEYRGLSTAAAKCAAFGRDDVCSLLGRETTACFPTFPRLAEGYAPVVGLVGGAGWA